MRELIHRSAAQSRGLDERSADQRRADTLIDLVLGRTSQPVRPVVTVTVALSTLLAVDEQPGELTGGQPIPAALARALAFDPNRTWRPLVTDPLGQFLDTNPHPHRPGADLDHRIAWDHGGTTTAANLHALCTRHHHLKHETRWRVHQPRDATTTWTTPTGHHYRQPPPVDTTTNPAPSGPRPSPVFHASLVQ